MSNETESTRIIEGLEQIPQRSESVSSEARSIESQIDEIEETYENTRERAEEGVPEEYRWEGLDEIPAERTTIPVDHSLDKLETDIFPTEDNNAIELDAENRQEYIRELVSRVEEKKEVKEDFQGRIDAVKELSGESLQEFLQSTHSLEEYDSPSDALDGSWGEKLDQRLSMAEGKRETQRIIEDIVNRAEAEQQALENELQNEIDRYTEEIYDQAVAASKRLGGKGRPYTGELDLLQQLSSTRAEIISNRLGDDEYSHNSDDVAQQEGALDKGKQAMEAQAQLIAHYAMNLDEARQDTAQAIEEASAVLENDRLESARERIAALEEGYEGFGNSFEDKCYDSLSEAVEAVMREGMMEDEEFDSGYSVSFDQIPYLGSKTQSSM